MAKKIFLFMSCLIIAACGFHLRGFYEVPRVLKRMDIRSSTPYSAFSKQLEKNLKTNDVNVVKLPEKAPVTLQILNETLTEYENTVSFSTLVRDYSLTFSVQYQLVRQDGTIIQAPSTISVSKHYVADSNQMLGATNTKTRLTEELTRDAANQMLSRLSARRMLMQLKAAGL